MQLPQFKRSLYIFFIITPLLIFNACKKDDAPRPEPNTHKLLVAGYVPYYSFNRFDLNAIQNLNRIYYFSLWPTTDGKFQYYDRDIANIQKLKTTIASNECELFVVIGGMYESETIHGMAADKNKRSQYIEQLVQFCIDHQIDGVDLDWEHYPYPFNEEHFLALVKEMSEAFRQNDIKFTVALEILKTKLANLIEPYIDQLNMMSYGILDANGNHVSLPQLANWCEVYVNNGFPKNKLIAGVPFFAWRPYEEGNNSPRAISYKSIIEHTDPASHVNIYYNYGYNGPDMMQTKVKFLKNNKYYGIMAWELTQDVSVASPQSLLRAIDKSN